MSPQTKAPGPAVTIANPAADGSAFSGSAGGSVNPAGSGVTATFWTNGNGGGTRIDGTVNVSGTGWTAAFNMTGAGATNNGYLSAVNTGSGGEAHRQNLVCGAGPAPVPGPSPVPPPAT